MDSLIEAAEKLKLAIPDTAHKEAFDDLVDVLETCCEIIQRIEQTTEVPWASTQYRLEVNRLAQAASEFMSRPAVEDRIGQADE